MIRGSGKTAEYFLSAIEIPQGYSIDMSGYEGTTKGYVYTNCPDHGNLRVSPPRNLVIRSHFCYECGRAKAHPSTGSYQHFVDQATELYRGKYAYPETNNEYVNKKSWVEVTCSVHGHFRKTAQKHLSGQGCFKCRVDELCADGTLGGGYNAVFFKKYPEIGVQPGVLYYLRVGRRYKIGITRNLQRRIRSIRHHSKQDVAVVQTWNMTIRQAWVEEQRILKRYAASRISRRWSTELFDNDVMGLDTPKFKG